MSNTKNTETPKPALRFGSASVLGRGLAAEKAAATANPLVKKVDGPQQPAPNTPAIAQAPIAEEWELVEPARRMKIRVADCVSNPYQPRIFFPEARIRALAVSLAVRQIEAIKVTRLDAYPGKYVLIDGERRLRAAKSLGHEFIDAELRTEVKPADLYAIAFAANDEHDRQTIFDDAIAWQSLLDEGVYPDHASLSQVVGRDVPTISKILSLNKLPQHMLERMAEQYEKVGLQAAYFIGLIYRKAGEVVADNALSGVIDGKKTARDLEELNRKYADNAGTNAKTRVRYTFKDEVTINAQSLGEIKAFPDGRLELNLKGLDPDVQKRVAETIRQAIETSMRENSQQATE